MRKEPKRPAILQKLIGGAIIFEALAFGVSYLFWRKLNTSRENREKLKTSAPWALEMYYKMGEMMSDTNKSIRINDAIVWESSSKSKPLNKAD